jgi:SpoVK/Ycf46/Vps4 family AAA+-type ATPase
MAVVEARDGLCDPSLAFDDVIAGKGRGLNILLQYGSVLLLYAKVLTYESGELGLGKTLTAEAVAEHQKRALYSVCFTFLHPLMAGLTVQISAGELSTDAATLEVQLSWIFKIVGHWNAILLLDEADVFLEQRSSDLIRNSLVSVFLRKLEYCEGIMFLTTNRVAQFDKAILGRIHVMLKYGDLSKATGKKI